MPQEEETFEESGVHAQIGQLTGIYTNITSRIVIHAFMGSYLSGELTTSAESEEVIWLPREMVLKRMTHLPGRDRVQDMLEFSGSVLYRSYTNDPYKPVQEKKI